MATDNSTRSTSTIRLDSATTADLDEMSQHLNEFGALLAGVEEICGAEGVGVDALFVASRICRQINDSVCEIADRLCNLAKKGGAA